MDDNIVRVRKKAQSITKSQALPRYTQVIIITGEEEGADEEHVIISPSDGSGEGGATLELTCPWGTQEMADNILAQISGYRYTGYTALGTMIDPAVEIGDAVSANGIYGGIYAQDITFGHDYYSDIASPADEQLDHEYGYTESGSTQRSIIRTKKWTEEQFTIQDGEISAKVSKDSPDGQTNFWWKLHDNSFKIGKSNNTAVFTCDSSGITIDGNITARSGYIGNGSSGFTIGTKSIANGMTSLSDTTNNGIYLGTDGIALGKGNFKVTSAGVLTAKSGSFKGNLTVDSITFSSGVTLNGSNITSGTVSSTQLGSGSVTTGKIEGGAVTKAKTASGVQTTLTNADSDHTSISNLFSSSGYVDNIYSTSAHLGKSASGSVYIYGQKAAWKSVSINGSYIYYLGYT